MQSLLVGPAVPCQGVKIVSSFPQDAKWACLSHCWGTTLNPIKLNKKSYKQYHDFISVAKLPKSFQDALRIARYLGLKYLWIDCFCIEQGSAIDFDMEASKMADVYRNSFILIVAAAAADSHGGCLIKSDPDKFIRITVDSQQNLYFGVRQCKFTKELEELTDVYEEFPTHERAWCYQEQVLAQRLLFCTNHELTFECRDLRACECDNHHMAPHISPSHGGHPARRRLLIRDKALIATLNSVRAKCYSVATINQCWEAAVYHYSRLKLGHAEQRLSALSGLAKTFQMISGRLRSENIYLAGLWRKAIRANLLWRVSKPSQIGTGRPRIYRAPSWSWASVDTPSGVDFLAGSSHQSSWLDMSDWEGFLVDANSVPSATDTTGAVKSGFLRFKTHLRIAHVRMPCSYCKNAMGLHGKGKRVQLETDCRQHRCTFHGERLQSLRGSFEFFNDCTLREEPGLRWKKSSGFRRQARPCMLAEIYLLHVAKSVTQKNCVDHFLALKKTKESCWRRACRYLLQGKEENARYPQFKRIGLVTMVHRKEDVRERWFETVWKAGFTSQEKVLIDLV